jgi:hypothetical protein
METLLNDDILGALIFLHTLVTIEALLSTSNKNSGKLEKGSTRQ